MSRVVGPVTQRSIARLEGAGRVPSARAGLGCSGKERSGQHYRRPEWQGAIAAIRTTRGG
jgi:hypothetical protein